MKEFLQVASISTEHRRVVEIFRTNVNNLSEANFVLKNLHERFPSCKITFDLADCDRILRIEGKACDIDIDAIVEIVKGQHYEIELIEG